MDRHAFLNRRNFLAASSAAAAFAIVPNLAAAQGKPGALKASQLQAGFTAPPAEAKPRIWWFWGESVTTDFGITKDLESFKRVGFGGVVLYEQVFIDAPDALKSLSPEFLGRVRFAAAECARLGLSLEVNSSNGYVAGGPWITPALGMQRLVGSEITVEGGRPVSERLPQPPTKLDYYSEVAVLAYPARAEPSLPSRPVYSSNATALNLEALFDTASTERVRISAQASGEPVYITIDHGQPFTARSLTYSQRPNSKALVIATQMPGNWTDNFYGQGMRLNAPLGWLESSDDGVTWTKIRQLPATGYQHDSWPQRTVSFPAKTARYFRLALEGWGRNTAYKDDDLVLWNVALLAAPRVDWWESKAGNIADFSDADRTPAYGPGEVVDPKTIIDLTARIKPDGTLDWTPPSGRWTILRLGHTPTGEKVDHGRPETTGLECDKLSAQAVKVQFDNYVGKLLEAVRGAPGAKISGVGMDSAEHGSQNWTPQFLAQFQRRRGYDLRPFLPVMMGVPVGSVETTDRVLFDVRRTIADLMSDEYYGTFRKLCNAAGMTLTAQAPGIATCLPSDNIQAKGRVDIPMGEFWMSQPEGTMDCREAASAAHLYGRPIAAAESFTGSPAHAYPGMMKPFSDAAFVNGINRIVVLAGNHQPFDDKRKPGVTEDRFFLPYQRNNTWWEQSGGFWTMLGRASFMLQQGQPVVDLLYHLGSDTPLKIATSRMRPAPPEGHDYDVCGDEELLRADVQNGDLVMPGGMRYPVLVLAGGEAMTLAAAKHVLALIKKGARVIAPVRPTHTPSYSDTAEQAQLLAIVAEIWGAQPQGAKGDRRVGAGTVLWGASPAEHLARLGVAKDFEAKGRATREVLYTHRRLQGGEVYFVANHRGHPVTIEALFRDGRGTPQAWDPSTGRRFALPAAKATAQGSEVSLRLEPFASLFVVFGAGAAPTEPLAPLLGDLAAWRKLDGPWGVAFEPNWGAPASIELTELVSLSKHDVAGVRNYSGLATYTKRFELDQAPTGSVWLDLGQVSVVATVLVNGKEIDTLWKAPFAVEIGRHLRKGENSLEVRVANLWANRLIADAGLAEDKRLSWTTFNPYKSTDALYPSGLIGPVTLRR